MDILQAALVILVGVWTLIFLVIAIGILMVVFMVRKGLKTANKILDEAAQEAEKVNLPSKMVIATILAFMAQNSFGSIKDFIQKNLLKKSSKRS